MKKSEALNILGLQDGASDDDIKKAHRKLVIENHPDKFGADAAARAKAEEKTKLINEHAMYCFHANGRPNTLLQEPLMGLLSPINPIRAPMEMVRIRRAITPSLVGPFRVLISYGPLGMPKATPAPIARMAKKVHLAEIPLVGIAPITLSAPQILSLARSPSTSPPSGKRARPNRCSKKRRDRFAAILRSLQ